MTRTRCTRLIALLAFGLAGCASPNLTAPTLSGFNSSQEAPASSRDEAGRPSTGSGTIPATPADPGNSPAIPAEPGKKTDGSSTGGVAVPGVGLSTFFDTYNFNFPVPAGQALGAVANVSHAHLAPGGGKLYLQVGLQTTNQTAGTKQPLNISFVFDKSGSMFGEKIAYSRTAASQMVDTLGESDTFSLVTFDTHVETLIAPSVGGEKAAMKALIAAIAPGSQTNIDGGLQGGYSHVQNAYKADRINRVILMSDGAANVGITDPEVLGERAAAFAREGITLTTIGVGLGFNESFMTHLAKSGQGSFYFVNSAEEASQAFVGEVQALQRTVAKNVKLAITLAPGVEVVQIFGHNAETEGQSLNVDSNDLIAGQSKVILFELKVPAGAAGSDKSVATVSVDYDDVPFGGHKTAVAEAKVSYTEDAALTAKVDTQLASSVIILQTAAQLIRAAEQLDQGDVEGARTTLLQQLEVVTAKAEELGDADLKDEVVNLKQYLDRLSGATAAVIKKELQYDAFQKQQGKKKVVTTSYKLQPASSLAMRRMA